MSTPAGFVITVSCEGFFQDERKNIALFFSPDRMKTVNDLRQRLRSLVKTDFSVLWSPCDDENYYYLLKDEQLHFVKPKDKFRICKIRESSQGSENDIFKQEVGIVENRAHNTVEDEQEIDLAKNAGNDIMDFEDVVDAGTKKKRKRTRKHKSKKQKLDDDSERIISIVGAESTHGQDLSMINRNDCVKNGLMVNFPTSENRYIMDCASYRQENSLLDNDHCYEPVDPQKYSGAPTNLVNGDVENFKVVKRKDKKKSKKKEPLIPSEDISDIAPNKIVGCCEHNGESTVINSNSIIIDEIATSTALNTPASVSNKRARKRPLHSLASFINDLSNSLKKNDSSSKPTEIDEKSNSFSIHEHKAAIKSNGISESHVSVYETPSACLSSSQKVTTMNSTKTPYCDAHNSLNTSDTVSEFTHTNRKLNRKTKKLNENQCNENQLSVLENLKQLKYSNFADMPLVFERNPHQGKEVPTENIEVANNLAKSNENVLSNKSNYKVKEVTENGTKDIQRTEAPMINKTVNNLFDKLKHMPEEQLVAFPLLKDPVEHDKIIFKLLKMDASYNPSLSNYIGAYILSICETTKELSLQILFGSEELKAPKGKFSLESEECDDRVATSLSLNWNEMFHVRSLNS